MLKCSLNGVITTFENLPIVPIILIQKIAGCVALVPFAIAVVLVSRFVFKIKSYHVYKCVYIYSETCHDKIYCID